jgi:hypothetical protein
MATAFLNVKERDRLFHNVLEVRQRQGESSGTIKSGIKHAKPGEVELVVASCQVCWLTCGCAI